MATGLNSAAAASYQLKRLTSNIPKTPELAQPPSAESDRGSIDAAVLHEFNNVIGSIMGNAEMADLELDPSHPAKTAITEVVKSSKRARELLRLLKARGPAPT